MAHPTAPGEPFMGMEVWYRELLESSPDPYTILEPVRDGTGAIVDFIYRDLNSASTRLILTLGRFDLDRTTREDLLAHSVTELSRHTGLAPRFDVYTDVIATRTPRRFERAFDLDGERRVYAFVVAPFRHGVVVTGRDVTTERLAERRARRGEARLAATLRAITEGVIATDADGRISLMNPAATRVTGWPFDDARGASLEMVFRLRSEDTGEILAVVPADRAEDAGPATCSGLLEQRSGARIPVEYSVASIHPSGDAVAGSVYVFRDARPAREEEASLAATARTASIGTMAAAMAHEINNPLSYVIGNIDFVRDIVAHAAGTSPGGPGPLAEALDALDDALDGAGRIRDIVADLQRFVRPAAAGPQALDPQRAVEAALRMAGHELRHRAPVRTSFEPTPMLLGDAVLLGQIALNLLLATAHHIRTHPDHAHAVTVSVGTDADGHAFIEVANAGMVLSATDLAQLFEPFWATRSASGGEGGRLNVARRLTERMGGRIAAHTIQGGGTAVRVTLPAEGPEDPGDLVTAGR